MKIAHKVSISFFAIAMTITFVAMALFYTMVKNDLQNAVREHLQMTATSKMAHVETFLLKHEDEAELMAMSNSVKDTLKTVVAGGPDSEKFRKKMIRELKRNLQAQPHFYEIFILAPDGKIIISTDESHVGLDGSTDDYFLEGQTAPYIKDAHYSEEMKKKLIIIAVPIRDNASGELLGVLVVRMGFSGLHKITTDKTGLGETGDVYIVNRYGYMITPSRFLKDTFLKQKVDTLNFRKSRLHISKGRVLKEELEVVSAFPDYRGVKVLGAHEYLPRMKWVLLAEMEEKEALAVLDKLKLLFVIVTIFILVITALASAIISQVIARRISKLHKGLEIVGGGNLDHKIGIDTKDEVGEFSMAFDAMTERLKRTTASIDSLNRVILDREKITESLRISERKFKDLAETIADWIWEVDEDGVYTYTSPMVKNILGYESDEVLGKTMFDLMPVEEARRVSKFFEEKVVRKEPFYGLQNINLHKDGYFVAMEMSAKPVFDKEGQLIGYRGVVRDITARRKAEKVMEETNQQLKVINIELAARERQSRILNFKLAKRFKEIKCLYGLARITGEPGISLEEVFQRTVKLIPSGWRYTDNTCAKIIFKNKEFKTNNYRAAEWGQFVNIEIRGKKVGVVEVGLFEKPAEAGAVAFLEEEEELLRAIASWLGEVIERKEMEEKVKEVMEVKSEFISMVSHELRTPLTSIKEGVSIILDGILGKVSDEQKDFLNVVKKNADRLARLIDNVLDFQKLEAGKVKFDMRKNNMNEVVKESCRAMSTLVDGKGLKCTFKPDDKLPMVKFDRDKILQVLTNFLSNAIKFTEKGGITITTSREGDSVIRVSVKDTGSGIKKTDLPKLFKRFEQLGKGGSRKTGGTGLGLAISREIIEYHKGRIWAESEPGKGTTFFFELPIGK